MGQVSRSKTSSSASPGVRDRSKSPVHRPRSIAGKAGQGASPTASSPTTTSASTSSGSKSKREGKEAAATSPTVDASSALWFSVAGAMKGLGGSKSHASPPAARAGSTSSSSSGSSSAARERSGPAPSSLGQGKMSPRQRAASQHANQDKERGADNNPFSPSTAQLQLRGSSGVLGAHRRRANHSIARHQQQLQQQQQQQQYLPKGFSPSSLWCLGCPGGPGAGGGMSRGALFRATLVWGTSICLLFASMALLEQSTQAPGPSLPSSTSPGDGGAAHAMGRSSLYSASSLGMHMRLLGVSLASLRASTPGGGAQARGVAPPCEAGTTSLSGAALGAGAGARAGAGGGAGVVGVSGGGDTLRLAQRGRHLTKDAAAASVASLQGLPEVTIFAAPQPFALDPADPQMLALRSWVALPPSVKVVLVGSDETVARAAEEVMGPRVSVQPHVDCDLFGMPLLSSMLDLMQRYRAEETQRRWEQLCGESGGGSAAEGAKAKGPCALPEGVPEPAPPATVLLTSADVLLTVDILPAFRKLNELSDRWAALGASWQVEEELGIPLGLVPEMAAFKEGGRGGGDEVKHRVVESFLKMQGQLRSFVHRRGALDPLGPVDFFAWGGGGWGFDLLPGRYKVPPLSLGNPNVTRWLAGALSSSDGVARAGPAGEVERAPELKRGASSLPLVVDVSDVLTVVHVGHAKWAKEELPRGRAWPGHGKRRKSKQLGMWQSLRAQYLQARAAQEEDRRIQQRIQKDGEERRRSMREEGKGKGAGAGAGTLAQRPMPDSPHWLGSTLGSPLLAPYELVACADGESRHMCLKPRISPGRCLCHHTAFHKASLGDPQLAPNGHQFYCGDNTLKLPPPEADSLLKAPSRNPRKGKVLPFKPANGLVSMEDLLPFVATKEADGTNWVILVGITGRYNFMLMNFVCNLKRLNLSQHLAIAAMDSEAYSYALAHGLAVYYEGYPKMANGRRPGEAGCEYGTACFQQLTKVKSRAVLRVLKAGYTVLWTDVDIVWFTNPMPILLKYPAGQLPIQANEPLARRPSKINSGFYLARPDKMTVGAFEGIVAHAAKTNKSEQPSFNEVLCGERGPYKVKGKPECMHPNGLRTIFLDRKQFANGAIFDFWGAPNVTKRCKENGCIILHNNWISGKDSKEIRFIRKGFWYYDIEREVCSPYPLSSPNRTTVNQGPEVPQVTTQVNGMTDILGGQGNALTQ